MDGTSQSLAVRGLSKLRAAWSEALSRGPDENYEPSLAASIDIVFAGVEGKQTTPLIGYRKALIIQAAGKAANFDLDAQSLQRGDGRDGKWDAREFAKRVFVPWNAENGSLLGDSPDPYVSNQFRNPRFDVGIRGQRGGKLVFDTTLNLLQRLQGAPDEPAVDGFLVDVLLGLRRYLSGKSFDYPTPNRSSLADTLACLERFLQRGSGGVRLQACSLAMFDTLRDAGVAYQSLRSGHINAADKSGNRAGDIEFDLQDRRWAVEVKDRPLTTAEVRNSAEKGRVSTVSEMVFVVNARRDTLFTDDAARLEIEEIARTQFNSGLNLYFESFFTLAAAVLAIVGESGRAKFLNHVGQALNDQRADAQHRWEWANIVNAI